MSYIVDILDQPFRVDNQTISDQTVQISFITPSGVVSRRENYGVADREHILMQFRQSGYVQLDHLYLKDFTLNDTRTRQYERLSIKGVSARKSFFDGDTDFSQTDFIDHPLSFHETVFYGGTVDFSDCRFLCEKVSFSKAEMHIRNIYFDDSRFMECRLNFSGLTMESGDFHFFSVNCLRSELDFSGAHFSSGFKDFRKLYVKDGNLNFSSVNFNSGDTDFIELTHIKGALDFKRATFGHGELNFGGSRLSDGEKDFSYVVFPEGMVSFSDVHFGAGTLLMMDARFRKGNIYFTRCRFDSGELSFTGTDFGDGFLEFCDSQMGVESFTVASCRFGKGDVDFSRVKLPCSVMRFYRTEFNEGKLVFSDAEVESLRFSECTFNSHVYVNLRSHRELKVMNCIIEKTLDLRNPADADMEQPRVLNLTGTKNLGHLYIDWEHDRVRDSIYRQGDTTTVFDKASQFRLLKENFRIIGHYGDEDNAYVEYKRCERQGRYSSAQLRAATGDMSPLVALVYIARAKCYQFFTWLFFDRIGRFGTSPVSVFVAMLQALVLYACIYALPIIDLSKASKFSAFENPALRKLLQALYHSIGTFLTIGYGDVNPNDVLGMLVSAAEGFTGVFMMSYFTVSVVRKLLR